MPTTEVRTHHNFINGQWTPSDSGRTYSTYNPAHKDELLGHFQLSNPEDTLRAVAAAAEAAPGWADTPAPVRAQALFRALEIMERRAEEIARTITEEEGKPLPDARGEGEAGDEHNRVRRRRRAADVRLHHAVGTAQHRGLYGAPSPGRGWHHHAVELPHRHSRVEDGAGDDLRQRHHLQAGVGNAAVRGEVDRGF